MGRATWPTELAEAPVETAEALPTEVAEASVETAEVPPTEVAEAPVETKRRKARSGGTRTELTLKYTARVHSQ